MSELLWDSLVTVPSPAPGLSGGDLAVGGKADLALPARDGIRDALTESRQRLQHLVSLASDLAFETDAGGRFVLMTPETVLGRSAASLIGQPSQVLLADAASFNPFGPAVEVRRHRAWLRNEDGGLAMMTISAAPLFDAAGRMIGARGIGVDMTESDAQGVQIAGRLRRGQMLHHILSRVINETDADSMMDTALWAVIQALGAEGAAVFGALDADAKIEVLHECGPGASAVLDAASQLLMGPPGGAPGVVDMTPSDSENFDGRMLLGARCQSRSLFHAGLGIWRVAKSRPWDAEDKALTGAAVCIVRMILEYEGMQREMTHQARTDPLTGLLNRRAFMEELRRHIPRLDRESESGTLMFIDMDAFKAINDQLGHAVGDKVLVRLADMLRKLVRPTDLVMRMGGDEFAVWLNGADHMTAAERADFLCRSVPMEMQELLPEEFPRLGVSIGIATRRAGSQESIEDLTRRADLAMYEVKRGGRRHWRVSLLEGD